MRKRSFGQALGLGFAFVGSLLILAGTAFSDIAPSPKNVIPPKTHFTVATPGSQWLNVSRALTAEDLRDKIVLLDFWTYCCINCIHTLPEIAKLEKEFKNDLAVIGVHSAKFDTEKETDAIRQAVLRYGVEHPVVNDRDFRIWRSFEVRSWPTLVLLKPNGEIAKVYSGEGHTDELRKDIRALKREFPKRSTTKMPIELEREKVAKGEFFYPSKLAFDETSKTLFVSDSSHQQIAAYTWNEKEPGVLKPAFRIGKANEPGLANGSYASARFRRPQGLLAARGVLYVADTENHVIRKVDLKSKSVSTIAGTGVQGGIPKATKGLPAKSTPLASPWDLAFHPDEEEVVIAMAGTHQLWSLHLKSGRMSVIAGSGEESITDGLQAEKNSLSQPSGVSSLLGSLYFIDAETSSLRFYFEGYVRTLVGTGLFDFGFKDGDRKKAQMQHPLGIFADVTGVYVADAYNHSIRRYDPAKQSMETVIGDGKAGEGASEGPEVAAKTRLNEPTGITKLAEGYFAIADTNNHRIMVWNRATGKVERLRVEGEKIAATKISDEAMKSGTAVVAQKRISVRLPNMLAIPEAKVNRASPEVRIVLPERYKLNAEGPSFARLFEGNPPKEALKQEWKREDLLTSLNLAVKELKPETDYIFQGTFYYCLDTKNAVCEIGSVSFPVRVDPSGGEKIEVPLASAAKK